MMNRRADRLLAETMIGVHGLEGLESDCLQLAKPDLELELSPCSDAELLSLLFDDSSRWQQVPSPSHVLDLNLASPPNMFEASREEQMSGPIVERRVKRRNTPPPPYSTLNRPDSSRKTSNKELIEMNEGLLQQSLGELEQCVVKTELFEQDSELRRALNDRSLANDLNTVDLASLAASVSSEGNSSCTEIKTELEFSLDDCMEPLLSQAMEEVKDEIDATSVLLDISNDPGQWSVDDFFKWLRFSLSSDNSKTMIAKQQPSLDDSFNANNVTKTHINSLLAPFHSAETVDMIFAQLEVWRNAVHYSPPKSMSSHSESRSTPPPPYPMSLASTDDEEEVSLPSTKSKSPSIHLWQFVKELLQQPQLYSDCIYWLERESGVFKIVDSARVAALWGQRKNRPAMNYDKLSRSLRQYYRKGIMRKTERTQRLVYQFCPPYHL